MSARLGQARRDTSMLVVETPIHTAQFADKPAQALAAKMLWLGLVTMNVARPGGVSPSMLASVLRSIQPDFNDADALLALRVLHSMGMAVIAVGTRGPNASITPLGADIVEYRRAMPPLMQRR
jgi:hypothetical protein